MVCLNKIMISGHSSIHGHCNDKGINNSMINLTYYSVLYILSERKKGLCIRLSVYQEVSYAYMDTSQLQNYIEMYVKNFLKVKMPFTST